MLWNSLASFFFWRQLGLEYLKHRWSYWTNDRLILLFKELPSSFCHSLSLQASNEKCLLHISPSWYCLKSFTQCFGWRLLIYSIAVVSLVYCNFLVKCSDELHSIFSPVRTVRSKNSLLHLPRGITLISPV